MSTKTRQKKDILGLFFHTFEAKEICWQGRVISSSASGFYLVELFEGFMGGHHCYRLVKIEEMTAWQFYASAEDMRAVREQMRKPA